jgi:hypothetical protein
MSVCSWKCADEPGQENSVLDCIGTENWGKVDVEVPGLVKYLSEGAAACAILSQACQK